jgi:hypothetical protein
MTSLIVWPVSAEIWDQREQAHDLGESSFYLTPTLPTSTPVARQILPPNQRQPSNPRSVQSGIIACPFNMVSVHFKFPPGEPKTPPRSCEADAGVPHPGNDMRRGRLYVMCSKVSLSTVAPRGHKTGPSAGFPAPLSRGPLVSRRVGSWGAQTGHRASDKPEKESDQQRLRGEWTIDSHR